MSIKNLINRLSPICKSALEAGVKHAVAARHEVVDVPHLLLEILKNKDSDMSILLAHYHISVNDVLSEVNHVLDHMHKGSGATPSFSQNMMHWLEHSWLMTTVELGSDTLRSAACLKTLLDGRGLLGWCVETVPALVSIPRDVFDKEWVDLLVNMPEGQVTAHTSNGHPSNSGSQGPSHTPNLDTYTQDWTALARDGKLHDVWGRDQQVEALINVLLRSRQNNPILVGEAGVGKTAVAEALALRIVCNDVPESLRGARILSLDVGMLEAGAGVRGEFEDRLKKIIKEVHSSEDDIILFVDEAHTLLGVDRDKQPGNLLKPDLARGTLRIIAATTWKEYKKYIEKDAALVRRFQVVEVPEPSPEDAIHMLRVVAQTFSAKHNVHITNDALMAAVCLSQRYLGERKLPDKAISLLDTACARVRVSQNVRPLALTHAERKQKALMVELEFLRKETLYGKSMEKRIAECESDIQLAAQDVSRLQQQFDTEKKLAEDILKALKDSSTSAGKLWDESGQVTPLVYPFVDKNVIASVLNNWTGIPIENMVYDEGQAMLSIGCDLRKRIVGQDDAMDTIADTMMVHKARLEAPEKPIGVFMLLGPSGVGKTETAHALADRFFGGQLITVNMSEYQEPHTVSTLRGSPPGYVGYGQGGVLTEAVRRAPYSVVLLDEIEKAHKDVIEVFYQVFDKGILEDGEGIRVDFKNTVIIMTSNIATELLSQEDSMSSDQLKDALQKEAQQHFPLAFLGRLTVVPYFALKKEMVEQILRIKWDVVVRRVYLEYKSNLVCTDAAHQAIVQYCLSNVSGARCIDQLINHRILPMLARQFLTNPASAQTIVDYNDKESFVLKIKTAG